ncbi:MAG: hypothetical protein D3923_08845 [Candidatus Electrothrix sp. AR3]|nr:hypothetical protein [Candidatus Electrothrix sp. AR3]
MSFTRFFHLAKVLKPCSPLHTGQAQGPAAPTACTEKRRTKVDLPTGLPHYEGISKKKPLLGTEL